MGAAAVVNAVGDVLMMTVPCLPVHLRQTERGWSKTIPLRFVNWDGPTGTNTTLMVVFTNAKLTKREINMVAQRAHDGMAIAIRPAHTRHDGDTAFALATGQVEAPYNLVANAAVTAISEAIRNAVRHAKTIGPVIGLG